MNNDTMIAALRYAGQRYPNDTTTYIAVVEAFVDGTIWKQETMRADIEIRNRDHEENQ